MLCGLRSVMRPSAVALFALLAALLVPGVGVQAATITPSAKLTFSDSGITETKAGNGYEIDGTALSITAAGVYDITGSCSEGSIAVAKGLSDVVLVLDDLTLTSSSTAPLVIKKSSTVTIHLEGTSSLTDAEDPEDENSTDTTVADAFEGACVKVKSGSSVTFCGGGTLNVYGNAKNGIKGGATSSLIFNLDTDAGTISANTANNGIASDGSLVFNSGIYRVEADNDGIKSVPDVDDADSEGSVTVNGGTFYLDVDGDGIQAEKVTINNGSFTIETLGGYNVSGTKYYNVKNNKSTGTTGTFDADTMSCKGIKASGDRENIDFDLVINGGAFSLNCADDAVHSDAYAEITGGSFVIYTGDDGMHADTSLTIGTDGGNARDPEITVNAAYEGLEAGNVYIYSGRHFLTNVVDDGINAADGSANGTDGGGNDPFNPGGGPGGPGGFGSTASDTSDYNLYIYGGEIYVDCLGDGLDSNGGLYLYGGKVAVFSMAMGGDNSPFDSDGSWVVSGATVFGAGTNPMGESPAYASTNKYFTQTTSRSAGTTLSVAYGSTVKYSCTLPRAINYLFYSDPDMTGTSCTVSTGSLTSCANAAWRSSWEHSWNDGRTSGGVTTYTCSICGATEKMTAAEADTYSCEGHEVIVECDHENVSNPAWTWAGDYSTATLSLACSDCGETFTTDGTVTSVLTDSDTITFTATAVYNGETYTDTRTAAPFTVTFVTDDGADVDIYYTQDTSAASESGVTSGVARDSSTGYPVITGDGQINFTVNVKDGYEFDGLTRDNVSGGYKNLKDNSTDDLPYTYRITKITGAVTVTITTSQVHVHTTTYVEAEDPACTEDGHAAYWICTICGKYFSDEAGETEITQDDITIAATGHDYQLEGWTWAEDCSTAAAAFACANDASHTETVTAEITVTSNTASCEADGTKTYTAAAVLDGNTYTDTKTETVSATGHDYQFGGWTWRDDYSMADVKFVCVNDASHTVTVTGTVTSETTAASCETAGKTVYTAAAVYEGTTYTDTKEITIAATGHDWDGGKVKKAAKANAAGVFVYTCGNDSFHTKEVQIPLLLAKMTAVKKTKLKFTWNREPLADGYEIYFAKCNSGDSKNGYKLAKTITRNTTTSWTKTGLKKYSSYKAYVKAYKMINGKKKYIAVSCTLHGFTGNRSSKYCNAKKVTLAKKSVTIAAGASYKIRKTKISKTISSKAVVTHAKKLRYATSDPAVAVVNTSGKITAKSAGTCKIYVIANNGISAAMAITVK